MHFGQRVHLISAPSRHFTLLADLHNGWWRARLDGVSSVLFRVHESHVAVDQPSAQ